MTETVAPDHIKTHLEKDPSVTHKHSKVIATHSSSIPRDTLDAAAIVSETDANGVITYVNEKFCAISGYGQQALIGQKHSILNANGYSDTFYQHLWQTIVAGKVWKGETCNRHAQNEQLYWLSTTIVGVINAETQQPEKYIAISFDITARKMLELSLHEQEQATKKIFESAGNPILIIKDGKIIDCNDASLEYLGYTSKSELTKLTIANISPPFQPDGMVSAQKLIELHELSEYPHPNRYEWQYQHSNGSCFNVEVSVTRVPWQNETVLYLQWRLLSERNHLTLASYTEKERMEVTFATIGDAVITTDSRGEVTFLNLAACRLTGWSLETAIGKPILDIVRLVDEHTRQPLANPIYRLFPIAPNEKHSDNIILISKGGSEFNVEDTVTPIYLKEGDLAGYVLVLRNVTEKFQLLKAVHWQAGHDLLTSLPNRALLADRFTHALINANRQGSLLGVCKMDLDDFKSINDLYGHTLGDQLLVAVTCRINSVIRGEDTLARLGGDEFALLIGNLNNIDEIQIFLERVLSAVSQPYELDDKTIQISASIGMSIYPLDNADADTLLRHADQAMYQAKQSGRNCFHLFDIELEQFAQHNYQTRERVRQALFANELCLFYQPKVNMRNCEVVGMEALLRWIHPEKGMVPPLAFLPLVEHCDLIIEIGEWVIEQALQQIAIWVEVGHSWVVSVNIAARHFQHPEFLTRLTAILAKYPQVPAHLLEIEILETVALENIELIRSLIQDCQALGVTFSLDDFGTGYSSLSYLKRLPADTLKVDQSFVRDMLDNKEDLALIEAVIGLASVFNRQVIAEGVETAEHGVLLMRLGCDLAQGYGIARPMPASAVIPWVQEFTPDPSWAMWANVEWELNDFPLLVAQYDHLRWLKKLLKAIEHKQVPTIDAEHKDHQHCRFGLWYEGHGTSKYKHMPEFTAIAPIHNKIHQLSNRVVELCEEGDFEMAQDVGHNLIKLNDRIMTQLILLQLTVANASLASSFSY